MKNRRYNRGVIDGGFRALQSLDVIDEGEEGG